MSMSDSGARLCNGYEAPMEDYLEALERDAHARPEPALAAHLAACASCRAGLEEMREVSALVRDAAVRLPEALAADPYFAVRAAARARESVRRGGDFWPQLEAFALRFMAAALSVAIMLGAMAVWGTQRSSAQAIARLRPADMRVLSPEVNPAPRNPDDVVVALWSSSAQRSGRQR